MWIMHGVATIHKTLKMTYIVGGTLYLQSIFFITCCSCLELYCLLGNFLLDSCLEAFSGNLSLFFKLVHTILSCSLSVYHIFILSFILLSFSSSLPPLSASTQPSTHTVFLHHVVCCSIWVLQRNLLLSFDGKMCRQYILPKQWGPVHQIVLWETQKVSLFWVFPLHFAVFLRCQFTDVGGASSMSLFHMLIWACGNL